MSNNRNGNEFQRLGAPRFPTSLTYRVPAAFLNAGRVLVRGAVTPR